MKIIGCLVYVILGLLFCYYEGAFDKKNDTVDFFCYLFMFLSWPVIFLVGIILVIVDFFHRYWWRTRRMLCMNKFWWFITVMILPLNAASIFYYIEQNTFNASFWHLVFIYTLLSATTGIRLSNIEERKDK